MKPIIVFDVNETLLDVRAMSSSFEQTFGDSTLLGEWFSTLLRYSLEVSVTGDYRPFDELARGALTMTAARHGHEPTAETVASVIGTMVELPAHPDVAEGLAKLSDAGFTLITLTNSRGEVVREQLTFAGIAEHFDRMLSVETVRAFKPSPGTYTFAAEAMDVAVGDLMLVAAHDWDVNGALLAGSQAAFIDRAGSTRAPHNQFPLLEAPDLIALAEKIIDVYP